MKTLTNKQLKIVLSAVMENNRHTYLMHSVTTWPSRKAQQVYHPSLRCLGAFLEPHLERDNGNCNKGKKTAG